VRVGLRACILGAAAALVGSRPASAIESFLDEFSVHLAPDPNTIYVGANFGLLVSNDGGATWRYACEPWIVSGSSSSTNASNVSQYELTSRGALLAAMFTQGDVTRSEDACHWSVASGFPAGAQPVQLAADPNEANVVLAAVLARPGAAPALNYVIRSLDGGKTFGAAHVLESADSLSAIAIARATPGIAYATSYSPGGGAAKIFASADSGATWGQPHAIGGIAAGATPRIAAIDPADARTIYLHVAGTVSDAVIVSRDGGATFAPLLTADVPISSFLVGSDGTLYAGSQSGKLYVKKAADAAFTAHPAPHLRCLGQRSGSERIYGCADMVVDGFSLGVSDDHGLTFAKVMSLRDLLGPLTCAEVQANCAAHWERIQGSLFGSDAGVVVPDGGTTRPDGGAGSPATGGGSGCASVGAAGTGVLLLLAAVAIRKSRQR
jgi:hypothetical protein